MTLAAPPLTRRPVPPITKPTATPMDVDAPTVIPPSIAPPVPKPYRPFDTPKGPVKYLELREDLTTEEYEKLNNLTDQFLKEGNLVSSSSL
jgi:hypothetical protein